MSASHDNQKLMRVLSMLGGVQVMLTLLGVVRSKVGALLLGTEGIGILGVFSGFVETIVAVTGLGLASAAIREIAKTEGNDVARIKTKKMVWQWASVTGAFGCVVTLLMAGWFSLWGFSSSDYKSAFVVLSFSMIFNSLQGVGIAILKGERRMRKLVMVQLLSTSAAVVVSLLFYYFMGINGIPYSILASAIVSSGVVLLNVESRVTKGLFSYNRLGEGKKMVTLGANMAAGSLLTVVGSLLLTMYISANGGLSEVGLYKSGWTIIGGYVGMVFTAFSTEYYPRLSALVGKGVDVSNTVSSQVVISLTLLTPIVLIIGLMAPYIVGILYTNDFNGVVPFLYAALPGLIFKAASWGYSYLFVAKSDTKVFFLTELISSIIVLVASIIGYKMYGQLGLGMGFTLAYGLYLLMTLVVVKIRYGLVFSGAECRQLLLSLGSVGVLILCVCLANNVWIYCLGGGMLLYFVRRLWRLYVGK